MKYRSSLVPDQPPTEMFQRGKRCYLCPGRRLPIQGVGPWPCDFVMIGEAPGRTEDRDRDEDGRGYPFIGESGRELSGLYLRLMGLSRDQVYITNLVKCIPTDQPDAELTPNPKLAACCAAEWIGAEIRTVQPRVIFTLGTLPYRMLFRGGYPEMEYQHGLPIMGQYKDWRGVVIPLYHPAYGIRQGRVMSQMVEDARMIGERLRRYNPDLDGDYGLDPYPGPGMEQPAWMTDGDYREVTAADGWERLQGELRKSAERARQSGVRPAMGIDVETVDGEPYCYSVALEPFSGYVIRCGSGDDPTVTQRIVDWVRECNSRLIMHFGTGEDVPVLEKLGYPVSLSDRWDDTMQALYVTQRHAGSLKVAAYRVLARVMEEYLDIVTPHSLAAVRLWLMESLQWLDTMHAPMGMDEAGAPLPDAYRPARTQGKGALAEYRDYLDTLSPARLLSLRGTLYRLPSESWAKSLISRVNKAKSGLEDIHSRLRRLQSDLDRDQDTNPWERWGNWSPDLQQRIADSVGPMPSRSLLHVPWNRTVQYSGRDADITIHLWQVLWGRLRGEWRGV